VALALAGAWISRWIGRMYHAAMTMKADFVNLFLDLAVQVWRERLPVGLSFREAEAVSGVFVTEGLTAATSVEGRLKGHVFYEFPEETALAIATALEGEERTEVDEPVFTIIETLAEAMSADMEQALARAGLASEVATPVLLAHGASVTIMEPQVWAHFDSDLGPMGVRVSLAGTAG